MTLQRSVRCLYDRMQLITRVFPQGIHTPLTHTHRSIFTHTPRTIPTSNFRLSTRLMSTDDVVSNAPAAASDVDRHSDHTAAFSCLRLRGIPFDISPSDIPPFLGLNVIDVLLDRTRTGRLSGEAYIILKDPSEAEVAMQKNKQYLGGRYIEVFGSNKEEYYKAVVNSYMAMSRSGDNYSCSNNNNNNMEWSSSSSSSFSNANSYGNNRRGTATSPIVKLRGLPFEATSEDVAMFFNSDNQLGLDSPIDESHIYMPVTRSGRPSGVAYVAFSNVDDATKSFKKHRQHIGRRYVEIYPSDEEERSREQEMFG